MCKCAWEEPLVACFMNMRAKQVSIQHVIIVRGVYSKGGGLLLRLRSNPLLECQKSQTRPYLDKSLYTPLPGLIPVYAPTWKNPCIRPYLDKSLYTPLPGQIPVYAPMVKILILNVLRAVLNF